MQGDGNLERIASEHLSEWVMFARVPNKLKVTQISDRKTFGDRNNKKCKGLKEEMSLECLRDNRSP